MELSALTVKIEKDRYNDSRYLKPPIEATASDRGSPKKSLGILWCHSVVVVVVAAKVGRLKFGKQQKKESLRSTRSR